jgi:hypothetical protein
VVEVEVVGTTMVGTTRLGDQHHRGAKVEEAEARHRVEVIEARHVVEAEEIEAFHAEEEIEAVEEEIEAVEEAEEEIEAGLVIQIEARHVEEIEAGHVMGEMIVEHHNDETTLGEMTFKEEEEITDATTKLTKGVPSI